MDPDSCIGYFMQNHLRQECIPVGCVPPEAVAVPRGSPPGTLREEAPPWEEASPSMRMKKQEFC